MKDSILKTAGVLAFATGLFSAPAQAIAPGTVTEGEYTSMALGVDLVGALPVGDFADEVGLGLGALARYEYQVKRSALGLTARAGYLIHLEKETEYTGLTVTTNHSMVPVLFGARYSLKGSPVYVAGDVGPVFNFIRTDEEPGSATTDFETTLGWTGGIGYELGPADVRLALSFPDATDMGKTTTIALSFGYNFWGLR